MKQLLFIIDRDGTLIENDDFFGKNSSWKNEIKFNEEVIYFLNYAQIKYQTTKIVISNQSGVARRLFSIIRVEEINNYIDTYLNSQGITIDSWNYCPDVDSLYAENHPEIKWDRRFVKQTTSRKPALFMVIKALKLIKQNFQQFDHTIILGDRSEDLQLAENLGGQYIEVKNKTSKELINNLRKKLIENYDIKVKQLHKPVRLWREPVIDPPTG